MTRHAARCVRNPHLAGLQILWYMEALIWRPDPSCRAGRDVRADIRPVTHTARLFHRSKGAERFDLRIISMEPENGCWRSLFSGGGAGPSYFGTQWSGPASAPRISRFTEPSAECRISKSLAFRRAHREGGRGDDWLDSARTAGMVHPAVLGGGGRGPVPVQALPSAWDRPDLVLTVWYPGFAGVLRFRPAVAAALRVQRVAGAGGA